MSTQSLRLGAIVSRGRLEALNQNIQSVLGKERINQLLPNDESVSFETKPADSTQALPSESFPNQNQKTLWDFSRNWDGSYTIEIEKRMPGRSDFGGHVTTVTQTHRLTIRDINGNGQLDEEDRVTTDATRDKLSKTFREHDTIHNTAAHQTEISRDLSNALNRMLGRTGLSIKKILSKDGDAFLSTRPLAQHPNRYLYIRKDSDKQITLGSVDFDQQGKLKYHQDGNLRVLDGDGNHLITRSREPISGNTRDRLRFGLSPEEEEREIALLDSISAVQPYMLGQDKPKELK